MEGKQILGVIFKHDMLLNMLTKDEGELRKLWEAAIQFRPASANETTRKKKEKWSLFKDDKKEKDRQEYDKPWKQKQVNFQSKSVGTL